MISEALIALGLGVSVPIADLSLFANSDHPAAKNSCALGDEERQQFQAQLNSIRAKSGLPAIEASETIRLAARAHSRDMAGRGVLSHFGRDGHDFVVRLASVNYRPAYAAENVAWNQLNVREVIAAWRASPAHNRAMMKRDITQFGLSRVCTRTGEPYWTLVVAKPLVQSAAANIGKRNQAKGE